MGDPNTGRIYDLGESERPDPGHVPLARQQADELEKMPLDERIDKLQEMAHASGTTGAATQPARGETVQPWKYPVTDAIRERIENSFTYHPPKGDQTDRYSALRATAKALAYEIVGKTPPGREQSLALTKLEESCFWMNAAIARGE